MNTDPWYTVWCDRTLTLHVTDLMPRARPIRWTTAVEKIPVFPTCDRSHQQKIVTTSNNSWFNYLYSRLWLVWGIQALRYNLAPRHKYRSFQDNRDFNSDVGVNKIYFSLKVVLPIWYKHGILIIIMFIEANSFRRSGTWRTKDQTSLVTKVHLTKARLFI